MRLVVTSSIDFLTPVSKEFVSEKYAHANLHSSHKQFLFCHMVVKGLLNSRKVLVWPIVMLNIKLTMFVVDFRSKEREFEMAFFRLVLFVCSGDNNVGHLDICM